MHLMRYLVLESHYDHRGGTGLKYPVVALNVENALIRPGACNESAKLCCCTSRFRFIHRSGAGPRWYKAQVMERERALGANAETASTPSRPRQSRHLISSSRRKVFTEKGNKVGRGRFCCNGIKTRTANEVRSIFVHTNGNMVTMTRSQPTLTT